MATLSKRALLPFGEYTKNIRLSLNSLEGVGLAGSLVFDINRIVQQVNSSQGLVLDSLDNFIIRAKIFYDAASGNSDSEDPDGPKGKV